MGISGAYPEVSCAWEEFTILVKADCQHPVRSVESFLDAISMMYIDVNVQYSLVITKELENTENNI
jgi:hypothetical protein